MLNKIDIILSYTTLFVGCGINVSPVLRDEKFPPPAPFRFWEMIENGNIVPPINSAQQWFKIRAWWRHQMETFSALLAICAGYSPVPGEFPLQRPVTRSFDVFFDLRLNKRLSKQSWGWWFETLLHPLWRQCNERFARRHSSHSPRKIIMRIHYFRIDTSLKAQQNCLHFQSTLCVTSLRPSQTNMRHMMTSSNGNIFRVTDHMCGEFTGSRWIPPTKASDAELWCFLWSE